MQNETVRNLEVLRSCLCYSDILQTALAVLRDSLANNSGDGQSTKRVKPTLAASRDFELVRLGLILENLNIKTMTADTGLLDTILGLLAGLVDMSSSQTDLDYYVQLVTTRASELVAALPVSPLTVLKNSGRKLTSTGQALEEEVDLRVGPVLETIRGKCSMHEDLLVSILSLNYSLEQSRYFQCGVESHGRSS